MLNNQKHKAASQATFMSSVQGLANVLAVIITFIGAPPFYGNTIGWVQSFTASNYGYGFEDITALAWGIATGCLVFFIARASVSTALVMGGLALATRIF